MTNAVIKLVRIAELPQSLFTILHHHFGISSLCLAEYNATSDSFKSYLVNQQQREQPGIINHSCFEKNCLQGRSATASPSSSIASRATAVSRAAASPPRSCLPMPTAPASCRCAIRATCWGC